MTELSGYVGIWLGYANLFIATFIMVYAYLFLKQTNEEKDRRPWDFLFVASLLYFAYQIFSLVFLQVPTIGGVQIDIIRDLFAFLYSGCVLLAFVSQHDLILRSQLILISKKDKPKPAAEQDIEVKIGLPGREDKSKRKR